MTDLVAERLHAVHERIRAAGGEGVRVLPVTKTFPVEACRAALAAGCEAVGENYAQEVVAKMAGIEDRIPVHFIGQLQTNKAASVARYADLVHSVDRESLVAALERGATRAARRLGCLIEVDLTDGATGRGGASPADVSGLAQLIADSDHLDLRGVMGVAPLAGEAEDQRAVSARAFERLSEISRRLREEYPDADLVSAGMSEDLEEAVRAGATHLRVGSAVLGTRPPLG